MRLDEFRDASERARCDPQRYDKLNEIPEMFFHHTYMVQYQRARSDFGRHICYIERSQTLGKVQQIPGVQQSHRPCKDAFTDWGQDTILTELLDDIVRVDDIVVNRPVELDIEFLRDLDHIFRIIDEQSEQVVKPLLFLGRIA